MAEDNVFLESAVVSWKAGFSIIPLYPRQKGPNFDILPKTRAGHSTWWRYKSRRATWKEVASWGEQCPTANYGIIGGLPSQVDDHYLYILDVEDRQGFYEMLRQVEEKFGSTMSVLSGRGGHIYLLSSVPVQSRDHTYNGVKYQILGHRKYALGPGCLHPNGGRYEVYDNPGIFAVADELPFCTLEHLRIGNLKRDVKSIAYHIAYRIHNEALRGRYRGQNSNYDKSSVMFAIVNACYNKNVPKDVIKSVLQDVQFETHYQKLLNESEAVAERQLQRCLDKSASHDSPRAKRVNRQMEELREWVEARPWTGRRGAIRRSVLLAHISRCYACKRRVYYLDARSGAELAQCHHLTFSRTTRDFIKEGLIRMVRKSHGGMPNLYSLRLRNFQKHTSPPKEGEGEMYAFGKSTEVAATNTIKSPPIKELTAPDRFGGVFERGGLSKSGEQIWLCLIGQLLDQKEIACRTGRARGTVSKKLSQLIQYGFVRQEGDKYTAILVSDADFHRIGLQLHTLRKGIQRWERHERERLAYHGTSRR